MRIKRPLPRAAYERNALTYRILANPKRLEILNLLREQEMAVADLVDELGISKSNVSQHLAVLRYEHLVTVRREGLSAYYSIVDPRIVEPCRVLHAMRNKKMHPRAK
ncbi:metalloregulator ArsR/SmtB family transcription factor [Candidatus Kaiserbacteria bacterium]|nr:metalloregulator ArsR/SmtB family transcription factor [Candidatus Kaiserbacteria bacterium]